MYSMVCLSGCVMAAEAGALIGPRFGFKKARSVLSPLSASSDLRQPLTGRGVYVGAVGDKL